MNVTSLGVNAQTEREAMWIQFHSRLPYAIKIYVGGVNAVSGEPAVETAATRLRRANLLRQNKSIQDYLVVPSQLWLDGVATNDGKVRQFVAMPAGSGYSVEAQVTGEEVTGGIQFEITPVDNLMQIEIDTGRVSEVPSPNSRVERETITYEVRGGTTLTEFRQRLQNDKRFNFRPTDRLRKGGSYLEGKEAK
jgi:hypothetical protein